VFAVTTPIMEDWQKANKRDKTDGMSRKAVKAYRREHPGSKLQTAVTTKPSKLKKGSKASKRRKSYCSRSRGQMKMHHISCAKTPDKAICKARRRWNCESLANNNAVIAEMDTQQPKGRIKSDGTRSHSTYGSRDHYSDADPQHVAKPTKAEKMMKHAHDVMMKSMSTADKVKKGWRNPNIDEGSEEQVYKVLAVDKSNALSKQVKLKVKASSLDEVFERLAISDWYPLEINGVEVIAGKRLKPGVAEGRFDEPLTGWHIVYRKSGNPVHATPSFETKDQAQKYLMTKMFANHQDYKVVHTAGVGVAEGEMDEAKYQGREVPLGKPMKGDVKKSKVYVRGPKGNVVKVNFGDKTMRIKKNIPGRRKNFRARHNCDNPGPRHKARYWSCRAW